MNLRHELAHYQRGDLWTTLLARCLALAQWFNPLAWWAASRFEAQCEFICDQASTSEDPAAFAEILIRLGSGGHARVAVEQAVRSGSLFERVHRLLTSSARPARWKCALPVAVAIVALGASAVRLKAVAVFDPADKKMSDAIATAGSRPLPPRGLLRIGTEDLRTRDYTITGIAFSPDGKLVAAAVANSPVPRITLFNVNTGRQARQISSPVKPAGWVTCVAFSPDGSKLVWGEIGGLVAVWDLTQDRLIFRQILHSAKVDDVRFSPDGTLMASAGDDGAVRLRQAGDPAVVFRDLETAKKRPAPRRAYTSVPAVLPVGPFCLAFTPDGTRLVVGSGSSATISIWRIKDGDLLRQIERAHGDRAGASSVGLNYVAVTPDGRRIVSCGESVVPITQTKLKYGPRNVNMSEVRVWDIETGARVLNLYDEEDHGFGYAALSPDGKHVAVSDFSLLRIMDTQTGEPQQTISLPGSWGSSVAFSPDSAVVAMPIQNTLALFDVHTGRRLHHDERMPEGLLVSAAWSPDGDRVVTGNADGQVRVWNARTAELMWHKLLAPVISRSGNNANPAFVTFSRDGRRVVAAGRRDDPIEYKNGVIAIYEATRGLLVREAFEKEIRHAALSPDRRIVVVATSHGGADDTHLIGVEVETGRTLWATPPVDQRAGLWQLKAIQFQRDSSALDVALGDGNVIHFDGLTGKEERRFLADWRSADQRRLNRPRTPDLWAGTLSADGGILVSSADDWVYVWDVKAGMLRHKIQHPHQHGCLLAVSAAGKTLATADFLYVGDQGQDSIRLFDVESGEQVLTLDPVDDRAGVLAFSPDGAKLFTGFHRGSAIVWDVKRGERASGTRK